MSVKHIRHGKDAEEDALVVKLAIALQKEGSWKVNIIPPCKHHPLPLLLVKSKGKGVRSYR